MCFDPVIFAISTSFEGVQQLILQMHLWNHLKSSWNSKLPQLQQESHLPEPHPLRYVQVPGAERASAWRYINRPSTHGLASIYLPEFLPETRQWRSAPGIGGSTLKMSDQCSVRQIKLQFGRLVWSFYPDYCLNEVLVILHHRFELPSVFGFVWVCELIIIDPYCCWYAGSNLEYLW